MAGLAVVFGVMACVHRGKLGSYQWMDAHFDAKKFPVQAGEVIARARHSRSQFSLWTPGVDTSSTGFILRTRFSWTTAMISTGKNS